MKKTKNIIVMVLVILLCFLTACENSNNSDMENIEEQLTGTWISQDSDNVYSKWTFYDGKYVVEMYVDEKKIDNTIVGTYFIGADSIQTITETGNTKGNIPYLFENGKLELIGANGTLTKDE